MDLKGKTAIITGASSGIGEALALKLLESGANVAGWSRSKPDIENDNFYFAEVDIRKPENVEQAFGKTIDRFGNSVHVLINNAGLGYYGKTDEMPLEQWHQMFDTNVHGLFYCTRTVLPFMRKQHLGHIINIASIAGLVGIDEGAGYCSTKFAVRGFSQSLFKEVRKDNIKVTCVYPGSVNTHFFDNYDGVTANDTMINPGDLAGLIIHTIETPDNFLTVDLEVRPMNPRYS